MNMGVYSSMNFDDNSGLERTWFHAFVLDILMGDAPWFDAQDVCALVPDVLRKDNGRSYYETYDSVTLSRSRTDETFWRESLRRLPLAEYVGVYGNFGYGNVTIHLDETETLLQFQYGKNGYYDLLPTQFEDVFEAVGNRSPADIIDIGRVHFGSVGGDGSIDSLVLPGFSFLSPPRFIRDLTLADAPPPSLEGCAP